jgi:uncharacterized protein YjbJ (UPF0337 family)
MAGRVSENAMAEPNAHWCVSCFQTSGVRVMNSNQDKGIGKQIKGTVKDLAGKISDDKFLEGEGKVERAAGRVQEQVGDAQQRNDERKRP